MNSTNQNQAIPSCTTLIFAVIGAIVLTFPLTSRAQVVIEGGPAKISISDQDGEREALVPGKNATILSTFPRAQDGATAAPPAPDPEEAVRNPVKEAPAGEKMNEKEVVTATAVVEPDAQSISPEMAKAMAEYERELGIEKSSLVAQVSFRAETLFGENGEKIDALAEAPLKKFANYLSLLDGEKATLTYHYVASEETAFQARARTLEMVEWFSRFAELKDYPFVVAQPLKIKEPAPVDSRVGDFETEFYPYVEIEVER